MQIHLLQCGVPKHTRSNAILRAYNGEDIAKVSQADPDIVRLWIKREATFEFLYDIMDVSEVVEVFRKAADIFANERFDDGCGGLSPHEFAVYYSRSTGAPVSVPLSTIERFRIFFETISDVLKAQALYNDIHVFELGYTSTAGRLVGWIPRGKHLFIGAPSNHPAVHMIWLSAVAMGYPVVVRPSAEDPFTPLRAIYALISAGMPRHMFSFYPGPHSLIPALVSACDLSILFGGPDLVKKYKKRAYTKVFGPGESILVVDDDHADDPEKIAEIAVPSMMKDGGRGCINLSAVVTTRNADKIAEAIATRVACIEIHDPLDRAAAVGAIKDPATARAIDTLIESALHSGARDITASFRSIPRLYESFGTQFLLPTVIVCNNTHAPLFKRELPFPFISITEVPRQYLSHATAGALVATLLSHDESLFREILMRPDVCKIYWGAIPTTEMDLRDPHEGFLADFLFQAKAVKGEFSEATCHSRQNLENSAI